MKIKQKYADLYTEYHKTNRWMKGEFMLDYVFEIQELVFKHKPENILDFGCGKRYSYTHHKVHRLWDVPVLFYDIGIPKYSKRPDTAQVDSIISCDVLEHIPEELIDEVLSYWAACEPKFVFCTVAGYPAIQKLPNGENAHCLIKSKEWWHKKLSQHFKHSEVTCEFRKTPGRSEYFVLNYRSN